jgi:glucose/arabinose dehydrogenase
MGISVRRGVISFLAAIGLLVAVVVRPARVLAAPALPAGFHAGVYAQGLSEPTAMSFGPDGRLYVAEATGAVVAIGRAGIQSVAGVAGTPLGLTWHAGKLYVSSTGQVETLTPARNYRSFSARVIIRGLPTGRHQNDGMAFGGGWMYIGIGSTCNACAESDPRSATIMRFHTNGSGGQIYARGLRNPYDLAFRPGTSQLYATDNGRDDFDDEVPDELNRIVRGGNYGWPNCWGNGGGSGCRGTIAPVALLEPHASADGLAFYAGRTFPARYRGDAFIAEFGQTVGGGYHGHKVVAVHFAGGRTAVSDFATGLVNPLAVAVAGNGSLLVADYGTGIIWSIQANGH